MLDLFGELIELLDWLVHGFAGWRYLFSSSYRKETHHRWKDRGKLRATLEIIAGLSGVIFTILIVWFVGNLIFDVLR
ncbi:MAG TPA: hypothetical protein VFZ34_15705 [Blastocatellia bacterium]|nr:hypothetical protein [Blastocatellia bacterium]